MAEARQRARDSAPFLMAPCAALALVVTACNAPDLRAVELPPRDFTCAPSAEPPCALTEPVRAASERTVLVRRDTEGRTLTFVLSELAFSSSCTEHAPGLDLDGIDSSAGSSDEGAPCEERTRDFGSVLDPLHRGVDNAFCGIVPTFETLVTPDDCPGGVTDGCLDASIARQVAEGALVLLVEVGGVDDLEHDASVTFQLYAGRVPGDGGPTLAPDGRLAPGQTFEIVAPLGEPGAGDLFAGRARVTTAALPIDLSVAAFDLPLLIRDAELRFDVSERAIVRGNAGGHLLLDEHLQPSPHGGDGPRSIVAPLADLLPSADAARCDAISIGFTFTGVVAERSP